MTDARRYAPHPGTLAGAVCIVLAFPPVEWAPLVWIGLVPWLLALERCRSLGEAVVQGLWLNVLLGLGGAFWVAYAVPRYLGVGLVAGLLALGAHALVSQLQLAIFAGVHWRTSRAKAPGRFLGLLALALLYVGIDWALPKLFRDDLGMALHASPALRQLAAIGGTPLLTLLVLIVNLGLFALLREYVALGGEDTRAARPVPLARRAAWALLPLAIAYAYGAFEYARVSRAVASPERMVRVGIVQGNVSDELKSRWAAGDAEAASLSLDVYLRATRRLLEAPVRPELVIWPETSYPGIFRKPENDAQLALNVAFDRQIAALATPLIFGAYDREDRRDRRVLRNSLYFVTPGRAQTRRELSPMQVYHKTILLPVAEYFPVLDSLLGEARMRRLLPGAAHFARGEGARVIEMQVSRPGAPRPPLGLAPSICYEDLFPEHIANLARAGAQLLVNVSNDSWFGDYGAARLHLVHARLRSVETRLPQVRVTNSGYSALILPNGDIQQRTAFGVEAEKAIDVPLVAMPPTILMRGGGWIGVASLVVGAGLVWVEGIGRLG